MYVGQVSEVRVSCHRCKLPPNQSKFLSLSHQPDRQHGQPLYRRFVSIETLHTLQPGWTSERWVLVCIYMSWFFFNCRCYFYVWSFLPTPTCFPALDLMSLCLHSGDICNPCFGCCFWPDSKLILNPDLSPAVFCAFVFSVVCVVCVPVHIVLGLVGINHASHSNLILHIGI